MPLGGIVAISRRKIKRTIDHRLRIANEAEAAREIAKPCVLLPVGLFELGPTEPNQPWG
jgi:hypothetical protein